MANHETCFSSENWLLESMMKAAIHPTDESRLFHYLIGINSILWVE
jgi:hypothetical protein